MSKPYLFLDVDGVLNVFEPTERECDVFTCTNSFGHLEEVLLPKHSKKRIKILLEHFEPVWATAWEGAAHSAFQKHLDLPVESWPHLDWLGIKTPEIIKYANGRAWAWVDDYAIWELDKLGWSGPEDWDEWHVHKRPHRFFEDNTFIIAPNSYSGMHNIHVEKLVEWAENL